MELKKLVLWFPLVLPLYLVRFSFGPLPTTALEILLGLLLVAITYKNGWKIWPTGWKKLGALRWPLIAWTLATAIAIVTAPNHIAALGLWRAYVLEPELFAILLAAALEKKEDVIELVHALIAITTVVAAWGVFQFATNLGIPHPWNVGLAERRATGPFPYPNALALFVDPIAALALALLADKQWKKERAWLVTGLIAGVVAVLVAKSVGSMVALLACAVIVGLWKKNLRAWTIGLIAAALIAMVAIPPVRTNIVDHLAFKEWSGKVRIIMYGETINMLRDHWFFGAGFGAYPDVIKPYHKATYIEIFQYPHDIILNLWSEAGLPGLFAFAWICGVWVWNSFKQKKSSAHPATVYRLPSTIFPLIAILIHGLVDVPYFKNDLAMLFWVFAVMAMCEKHYAKQD